jgi:tagatose 1,6-diphosphate aldolase GatY/KbaY
MAIASAREMLIEATEGQYAVGAFNFTSINQMEGIVEAAVNRRAPLILQTSVTPVKFLKPEVIAAAFRAIASMVDIPICLHLDHCDDLELAKRCAELGYTNIMIDTSRHDFEENIRQTRLVADYCHGIGGVSVEGELGTVSGVEDQVSVAEDEAQLCDPEKSYEFVERSGIDIFAPAIGTAHGVYRTENPKIDCERFGDIARRLNGGEVVAPLVVHGGTGLKDEVIQTLVKLGGAKYNVSTDLKYVLIDSTYGYIHAHRDEYNPGKIDKASRAATVARIETWITKLGCAGKA